MGIGDRLRHALDLMGVRINEAAEKAGIPYRSMQNYLRGEREPGAEALTAITARLGISSDWLLTGEGPMRRDEEWTAAPAPSLTPQEEALLTLFRELGETDQREILSAAEEKKRLSAIEQRLQEMEAALAAVQRSA